MVLHGGHNSKRDKEWITLGVVFALDMLSIDTSDIQVSECRILQKSSYHFGSFKTLLESAREDDNSVTVKEIDAFNKDETAKVKKHKLTPEEKDEIKTPINIYSCVTCCRSVA